MESCVEASQKTKNKAIISSRNLTALYLLRKFEISFLNNACISMLIDKLWIILSVYQQVNEVS